MVFQYRTAGESHGPCVVAVVEGCPAGMLLDTGAIDADLARRQGGHGRSHRQRIEEDRVQVLSGIRGGRTLGSPLTLMVANRSQGIDTLPPVTMPRPGHADLAGALKYGTRDARDILERASARETAGRVAAGGVARQLLKLLGIEVYGYVTRIGPVAASSLPETRPALIAARDSSAVYCPDPTASEAMKAAIDQAKADGDTLGGIFEVRVEGHPAGLGSHVAVDRRLDARLAAALMGIQAIKAVEIGIGFEGCALRGSQVHDEIVFRRGQAPESAGYDRPTNRAGGLEGGITNGQSLVLRAGMKPISTLMRALRSADLASGKAGEAAVERSDVCAVSAASVVGEAVVAMELAGAVCEKFAADTIAELTRSWRAYLGDLEGRRGAC